MAVVLMSPTSIATGLFKSVKSRGIRPWIFRVAIASLQLATHARRSLHPRNADVPKLARIVVRVVPDPVDFFAKRFPPSSAEESRSVAGVGSRR